MGTALRNIDDFVNVLPRLYERDIDVLLQEELIFNPKLTDLLAGALQIKGTMKVERCQLSVVDATGETDVLASFALGNRHGALFIENKIDAAFQPRQPERYRERAKAFAEINEDRLVFCVLIAPSHYVQPGNESFGHFDAVITYEEVAKAIEHDATPRSQYRASLLVRAVEQARSAYNMVSSENVGNLWRRIYRIANSEFVMLKMPMPTEKGSQSKWLIFKANLPPKITIDWKFTKGTVDLSFWKGAKHRPSEATVLSSLRAGASREIFGETIAISLPLEKPPAEWTDITDDQIRDSLRAASELLVYYDMNRASFS
jgi:hypothetical protein